MKTTAKTNYSTTGTNYQELLELFRQNMNKGTVLVIVKRVSSNGMSRDIRLVGRNGANVVCFDALAEELGYRGARNMHNGVQVRVCGMDMAYSLLSNMCEKYGIKVGRFTTI